MCEAAERAFKKEREKGHGKGHGKSCRKNGNKNDSCWKADEEIMEFTELTKEQLEKLKKHLHSI